MDSGWTRRPKEWEALMPRMKLRWWIVAVLLSPLLMPAGASASADDDRAQITRRLQDWAGAFNRRDASGVCDLFAQDLVSTVPDALDSGRDAVCERLAKVLSKPDVTLSYEPDIREIIVSGNLAVVRLFWTLTVESAGQRRTEREVGLDVFQRQPDGRWSIIRFMAFAAGQP